MDPQTYRKALRVKGMASAVIALGVGIAVLIDGRYVAEGAFLLAVGIVVGIIVARP